MGTRTSHPPAIPPEVIVTDPQAFTSLPMKRADLRIARLSDWWGSSQRGSPLRAEIGGLEGIADPERSDHRAGRCQCWVFKAYNMYTSARWSVSELKAADQLAAERGGRRDV